MIGNQLGAYEIIEEIGKGGMATVFRAYQPNMDRDVAVKVISMTISDSDEAVMRFQREARLIARLEHLHILPVYDFDGAHEPPYIVMRFLEGGTLKDVMKQAKIPLPEIGYLMRQVCSAVDYAHRQGIVHRDIKPSNIMIDREGNTFVTDFGIARIASETDDDKPITQTGATIGTPDYMAPEQGMGYDDVDYRADIYSLGVMLFEMLTGEKPFAARTPMEIVLKHVQEPVPSVLSFASDLPIAVESLLFRAMAKERDERYQSVSEFSDAIMVALGGTIASAPTQLRHAAEESQILMLKQREAKQDEIERTMATFAEGRSKPDTETSSQSTPTEQNKVVTALYANAAEYAEIVDEINGGEAARRAVYALWSEAETIIEQHGGMVFSKSEDTLLALWGAVVTQEDDAQQALRAGLQIEERLKVLGAVIFEDEDEDGLPLNIGINTGQALLTPTEDTGTYSASGATISLANRLSQNAIGTILISRETFRAVQGIFTIEEDAPMRVRGRKENLETYRVLFEKPRVFRVDIRGVQGVETQMIGRDAELKILQNALEDAFDEAETQVVTVIGDAGLGKSRLLQEFEIWSDLHPTTFRIFQGRATSAMTSRPYALLRDVISFRFQILDSDMPEVVREKMETGIVSLTQKQNTEMAHLIGHLVGFDFSESPHIRGIIGDPKQLTDRAKQLVKRLFVQIAAIEPIVMQLEDIHYSDDDSLMLINELIEELDELPLVIVALARPTLLDRFPTWGAGQRFHEVIELKALSNRDSRALVKEILQKIKEVPKTLRDLIVDHAEGNPYFIEEVVKMLIEDRIIIVGDETWTVQESRLQNLRVPPTLVGLLQARVDTLLYPEKLVLQRASVIGRIFYDSALAHIDSIDDAHIEDLPGILQTLIEREFIYERGTTAFEGHTEYIFAKTMMRDAIYDSLLRRQKQTYHQGTAQWLIEVAGERLEEYLSLIAEHYELGEDYEKAADYLYEAGDRAFFVGAATAASEFWQKALNLLPEAALAQRLKVMLRMSEPMRYRGELDRAEEITRAALALARQLQDIPSQIRALASAALVVSSKGDYDSSESLLKEGLALDTDDLEAKQDLLTGLAGLYWLTSRYQEGIPVAEEALSIAQEIGDDLVAARSLNLLGILTSFEVGEVGWDTPRQYYNQARETFERIGNRSGVSITLINLGEVLRRGEHDYEAARDAYEQSLEIGYELGEKATIIVNELNIALVNIALRDTDGAIQHGYRAVLTAIEVGSAPNYLAAVLAFSGIRILQDDVKTGLAWLGLAIHHPASDSNVREDAELIQDLIDELGLSEKEANAGMNKGKKLDLQKTIDKIQKEYASSQV